ncbi:pimeloyl-ACP methyl ester carboxylesterase [Allocatelliglobosispora scoriae]|uniref:Pimeloyl-ACP methyl ester carboxylesterase n=1 Tax=Allocatelliglobosispora scoriae TaxID=643052 RepID=A0A841BVN8_9ACTN|nr:alpha/beta hydrolase [Allocatelliglobosispora scoriae]MBB5870832.1 pimeloyl-ACP methyl ester carboxylesterase [Allocatelliglobosispora scoriae]
MPFAVRPRLGRSLAIVALVVLALLITAEGTAASVSTSAGVRLGDEPTVGRARFNAAFTHGVVSVEGTTIHYVKGGTGPAVLLLHGWPSTWWEWHDVMSGLVGKHTVIAVDLPGLGASTVPTGGFDKATTARRIHQALVKLGIGKATVVGHDVGVLVAYPYARDFPADVDRLVVIDLPLSGYGLEEFYTADFHFTFNLAPNPIPETILDTVDVPAYHGMIYDYAFNKPSIDRERYYLAYADPAKRHAGYEYYRAFATDAADNRANAAAKRLTMPVLTMGGDHSFGFVPAFFQPVAADVRGVTVPGAGHFVPEENPSFVAACLGYFLGDTAGTPPAAYAGCGA